MILGHARDIKSVQWEGVKDLDFEDFVGTTKSERNSSWLPVDRCMSSASSILRASAEKINELFGRRFLHKWDATMAEDAM